MLATEAMNRVAQAATIMGSIGDGVFALDPSGRISFMNAAAEEALSAKPGELIGRDMHSTVHRPNGDERETCLIMNTLRTGEVARQEDTFTRVDGTIVPIAYTSSPLLRDGEIVGSVLVTRDITERRIAERKLRERFEELRAISGLSDTAARAARVDEVLVAAVRSLAETLRAEPVALVVYEPGGPADVKATVGGAPGFHEALASAEPWARYAADPPPLILLDAAREAPEQAREAVVREGVAMLAYVPLLDQGRLIGFVAIGRRAAEAFSDEEVRVARTMARTVAFAIQRARAEDERARLLVAEQTARRETEAAVKRLTFLLEASRVLATSLDYWSTLSAAARLAVPFLADWCIVDVYDENRVIRRVAVAHADPAKADVANRLKAYPPDLGSRSPEATAFRSGQADIATEVTAAHLEAMAWNEDHLKVVRAMEPLSYVSLPLLAYGQTLGVLTLVSSTAERRYTRDDIPFAQELAVRAALAIYRARLYRDAYLARNDANAVARRAAFLADAGRVIAESANEEEMLSRLAWRSVPTIAEWCFIHLADATGAIRLVEVAHPDTARATHALYAEREYPPDPNAAIGVPHVIRTGRPELYVNVHDALLGALARGDKHLEALRGYGFDSLMILPLVARGRALGAVTFASTDSLRRLGTSDLSYGEELMRRAAYAVENARLFRELTALNADLEERIAARTRELKAANEDLEAFSHSVSHDLRAPLRGIEYLSQALIEEHGGKLDADGREHLERLQHESRRLTRLVTDLLALSRVSREPARDAVDLSSLAREVVAGLRRNGERRNVDVRIESGLTAVGDAALLRDALENLLGNAWKFTARTPKARIDFGATGENGVRAFFVRDNGPGFDSAKADLLFRPFTRLHAPADFEGTGIGLATVARIVHRHGGRVWAESAPGDGATFYFTLGT